MSLESVLPFPDTLQLELPATIGQRGPTLPSVFDFRRDALDPLMYARLGPEWSIAVVDVVGSTALASQGQDREVNFVAGAAVAALTAALTGAGREGGAPGGHGAAPADPPACQFTGDGALAAVPPGCTAEVRRVLGALVHWADDAFGVRLRAGLVPVSALRACGWQVLAALHDFGGGNTLGLFLGDGVDRADAWVKEGARWQVPPAAGALPGLEGLACRWNPVPAARGTILCVIADPVAGGEPGVTALARLLAALDAIMPSALASPLGDGRRLQPRAAPSRRAMRIELRAAGTDRVAVPPGWLGRLRTGLGLLPVRAGRLAQALLGAMWVRAAHALGGRLGPVDVDAYRQSIATRSDFCKLAGGLRLVLDVTEDEARRVEALLQAQEAAGQLRFGTARSPEVTLTCMVGDFSADRHVHFVDGSGLGFWRAAQALKAKPRPGAPTDPRPRTRTSSAGTAVAESP
ncbi:MAG: DUF3095 family protein [Rubrivivax sp.]